MASAAEAAYVARPVNPDRLDALTRHAGRSLLDVGCGNGAYATALPGHEVFGVDSTRFPTWDARPGRFLISDASSLPFRSGSFDTIACFETLEHLPDADAALAEYRRVTRRNLIVTVPHCEVTPGQRASNLIYHHWIDPTHRSFWTLNDVTELVASHGFSIREARLINYINVLPVVREAYGARLVGRVAVGMLRLARQRPYGMTSLVVADKVE